MIRDKSQIQKRTKALLEKAEKPKEFIRCSNDLKEQSTDKILRVVKKKSSQNL